MALASCSGNTAGTAAEGNGEAAAVEEAAAVTAEETKPDTMEYRKIVIRTAIKRR